MLCDVTLLKNTLAVKDTYLPDIGVIICDDREYLKAIVEGLLYGNYLSGGDRWRYYKAYELDLPTTVELKNMKSLIIWASTTSPTLKDQADDLTFPSWVRPIIKLIKNTYNTLPSLKMLGVSLGSHLIAIALGGRV